ncbi:MAG: hypothetical protein U0441_03025 [Polyangiaceae bacterium]
MRTSRPAVLFACLASVIAASPAAADEPAQPPPTHDTGAPHANSTAPQDDAGQGPEKEPVPTAKERRRSSRILLGVGGGALGAGWLMSVFHASIGKQSSTTCHTNALGFSDSCKESASFRFVFIPVVGPAIEAYLHDTPVTASDAAGFVFETLLQVGGLAMMGYGLAVRPNQSRSATAEPPALTIAVAPTITDRSASLSVVGTF